MVFKQCSLERMESSRILTIEWDMMDKSRFFSLNLVNSFFLRATLYPFTVIKTRLQIQKHRDVYRGTYDAFKKILHYEGFHGLYKGFWINTIQIVSGVGYIITYEKVRHLLTLYANIEDGRLKGLIGGGCGSLVGQTIITPFDVVSQHMMMLGQKSGSGVKSAEAANLLNIDFNQKHRRSVVASIINELYRKDGLKGFYRGYFASLCTYVPGSALWWMFYPLYSEWLASLLPVATSHLLIHCMAGPMGGISVCFITNPLDIVRARIQVQRMDSFLGTSILLWKEEGFRIFTKGVSARLVQSSIFSFLVVLGYETLKRWSVHDQYKDQIRW
ncbi:solute carrier family 25 member 44-like [Limulus polyphemus]|uniref:Solute carrier family 25 member 44-like n=1 Tax=Limulus polyphemus TaxID=6850 RepID=A0ABM1SAI2_LIMPO|nr:solute carrier family 25 member 44-like [Limulus polyphemus]XP_022240637.1 solute carrier family 25 member 44-like [Limulus polyphemus]